MNARICFAAAAFMLAASSAGAQSYPERAVDLIVPVGAGGSVDLVGRFLANGLSERWGQPVVVQNKPGAGMAVGSAYVAGTKPDGYTMLIISVTFSTNSAVQKSLPYDPIGDFTPVAMLGTVPLVTAVGKHLGVSDMKGLTEKAKASNLMYGGLGLGSVTHFAFELLNDTAGIKMEPIQYTKAQEAVLDVAGGRLDAFMGSATYMVTASQEGRIIPVAVGSDARLAALPDVPTLRELGLEESRVDQWWGILVPAGVPDDIVAKLNTDINAVMSTDQAHEFLAKTGGTPWTMPSGEFKSYLHNMIGRWQKIAAEVGISK